MGFTASAASPQGRGALAPLCDRVDPMSTFFPALQNSVLSRLLIVSLFFFLATLVALMTMGESESEASAPADAGIPLFISGGTNPPVRG